MKETSVSRKDYHLVRMTVLLSVFLFFFLINLFFDASVVAQHSSNPDSSTSTNCPPIINGISGSLTSADMLDITVQGDDCDGNTVSAQVRLLDARNTEVAKTVVTLNPPPQKGPFTVSIMVTGVSNFLGSCNAEVVFIDSDGNSSSPQLLNFRNCMLPIIGQFAVTPVNGDKIRAAIRGGDPDLNTNQIIFEIQNSSGSVLQGPTTFDSSAITLGLGDFFPILDINGISLLNNPGIVKVQLKDTRGNLSNPAQASFTAIKGQPDLLVTNISLNINSVSAGSNINVDITIKNIGDAPAGGSLGEIRLSTDQSITTSDLLLDSFTVASLNPGQVAEGSRMISIPANTSAGSYFVGIISDSGNSVGESNDANNTAFQLLKVQNTSDTIPPIVTVLTPKAGDAVLPGSTLKITYTSSDNIGVVSHNIDLSTDGSSFNPIAQNLAGNVKEFDFAVPVDFASATSTAIIRVIAIDAAGNASIGLSSPFAIGDTIKPTIQLSAPVGGETINAGTPFSLQFSATDNDMVTNVVASYSTDGGQSFPNLIGSVGTGVNELIWNVPDDLQTTLGRIQVVARDRSGNTASALSGTFTVQKQTSAAPSLVVSIDFQPPPAGVVAPPQNVQLDVDGIRRGTIVARLSVVTTRNIVKHYDIQTNDTGLELLGFNVYRLPEPPEGQSLPTAVEITQPKNLVGALPADANSFIDVVSTSKSDNTNFVYSITSFFGNGQMSNGSQPSGTDLPVIKTPTFTKGTIFLAAAGSFIKSGALLTINDNDSYKLQFDDSGTQFTVPKKTPSMGSGIFLKKLVKKGSTVKLTVKNPDGKTSVGMMFTRR